MTFDDPLKEQDEYKANIISNAQLTIGGIFVLEMLMKVLVYGLISNGPDSYLKDGWNIFDFVLVLIFVANFIAE